MKNRKIKSNSGLTLLEMMIGSALLALFSIFLVNFVMTTQKAWMIEHTAVPIRNDAKRALEVMVKEFREGDPSAYGGISISGSAPSQTIAFSVPREVNQSSILSYRAVTFAHNATQKYITRTTDGVTDIVARNIDSLLFSYSSSNQIVTATVGTSKATPEGTTLQTTLSAQARFRN